VHAVIHAAHAVTLAELAAAAVPAAAEAVTHAVHAVTHAELAAAALVAAAAAAVAAVVGDAVQLQRALRCAESHLAVSCLQIQTLQSTR